MSKMIRLSQMPLEARHWYILAVASAEQVIGGALSTVVGIMIPLILLLGSPHLSAFDQGLLGASGLTGIACGSIIMGQLMDKLGYLMLFRLCPAIILAGSIGVYLSDQVWSLSLFLFCTGIGVGGGYSLDSGYISELMPERWVKFMVGLAKTASSLGFIGGAAVSYVIILRDPSPRVWPYLIWFIGVMGLITLLLRIKWYQSPRWLLARGENAAAEKATHEFMGPDVEVTPLPEDTDVKPVPFTAMLHGRHLDKVILTGITWACEGLGVYGFGVFLPILVMALGMQGHTEPGIPKVLASVQSTVFINLFIAAGFALGLAVVHRIRLTNLMGWTFLVCAVSLLCLLAGNQLNWPVRVSFLSFVIFETALNAGPHLVTFILPSRVYDVEERGIGMGIATMLGKVGAMLGVFFMPLLLHWGGIVLVLIVSIIVQLIGAAISFHYGKKLNLL